MSKEPKSNIPQHVGIILDGNRRWAKSQGLQPMDGHKKGFETFQLIADAGLERGIKFLSVFAFSTENWKRSKEEVSFLLKFINFLIDKHLKELTNKNIRFLWFGSEEGLDRKLVKKLRQAEESSKSNDSATFCLCFNYGGQQEIVDSANKVLASGDKLSVESLGSSLYGGKDVPPIDLLVRTSGEERISNFMLWRAAYSELYFSDTLWPDFDEVELDKALDEYASRCRRFGG